jgi:hypothetical protein
MANHPSRYMMWLFLGSHGILEVLQVWMIHVFSESVFLHLTYTIVRTIQCLNQVSHPEPREFPMESISCRPSSLDKCIHLWQSLLERSRTVLLHMDYNNALVLKYLVDISPMVFHKNQNWKFISSYLIKSGIWGWYKIYGDAISLYHHYKIWGYKIKLHLIKSIHHYKIK